MAWRGSHTDPSSMLMVVIARMRKSLYVSSAPMKIIPGAVWGAVSASKIRLPLKQHPAPDVRNPLQNRQVDVYWVC